jgi:hypothetical protein
LTIFRADASLLTKKTAPAKLPAMPGRRLSDKILAAFDQACERREIEVAELLVRALELALTKVGGRGNVDKRHELGPVVEAYARLERLRGSGLGV